MDFASHTPMKLSVVMQIKDGNDSRREIKCKSSRIVLEKFSDEQKEQGS